MSATRSLLAAGGLTALVIAAVLIVGASNGAFGFGSDPAPAGLTVPIDAAPPDTLAAAPDAASVRLSYRDDDEDDEYDDDHDEHDHDDEDDHGEDDD